MTMACRRVTLRRGLCITYKQAMVVYDPPPADHCLNRDPYGTTFRLLVDRLKQHQLVYNTRLRPRLPTDQALKTQGLLPQCPLLRLEHHSTRPASSSESLQSVDHTETRVCLLSYLTSSAAGRCPLSEDGEPTGRRSQSACLPHHNPQQDAT